MPSAAVLCLRILPLPEREGNGGKGSNEGRARASDGWRAGEPVRGGGEGFDGDHQPPPALYSPARARPTPLHLLAPRASTRRPSSSRKTVRGHARQDGRTRARGGREGRGRDRNWGLLATGGPHLITRGLRGRVKLSLVHPVAHQRALPVRLRLVGRERLLHRGRPPAPLPPFLPLPSSPRVGTWNAWRL